MDYNRLLTENDSLSETNMALRKRVEELEAEVHALRQTEYFNGKTVEELKAEGYCIATVAPQELKPVPYISSIAGKGAAPVFTYSDVDKHKPAKPAFSGKQFNYDGDLY